MRCSPVVRRVGWLAVLAWCLTQGAASTPQPTDAVAQHLQMASAGAASDGSFPGVILKGSGSARPVLVQPANGANTPDALPTFTGMARPNSVVEVNIDGAVRIETTATAAGDFTVTPDRPLSDGLHAAFVTTMLSPGHRLLTSTLNRLVVDTLAPRAPVIHTPADDTTVSPTPNITGTAEASSSIQVSVDGHTIGSTMTDRTGHFSFLSSTPLADGEQVATVVAQDRTGNRSVRSAAHPFAVDPNAPAAPVLTQPADPTFTHDGSPSFDGTAAAGDTVEIYVDSVLIGASVADRTGSFSFTPSRALAETSHVAWAIATNPAGANSPQSNTNVITVDQTAPARPVLMVSTRGAAAADARPIITGFTEPDAFVDIVLDGAVVDSPTADDRGRFTFTPAAALAVGSHSAHAVVTDTAGNVSAPSPAMTFTVGSTRDVLRPADPAWPSGLCGSRSVARTSC